MAGSGLIQEIGDSLAHVLELEARERGVPLDVVQGRFDSAFFARERSAVALHLRQVVVDHQDNQQGAELEVEAQDDEGSWVLVYPRPLLLRLHWAVAGAGAGAQGERFVLSLALQAFQARPVLTKELRRGESLPDIDMPIDFDAAFCAPRQEALCTGLGVPPCALLGYRVVTEMRAERERSRIRRVERRRIELGDARRAAGR